MRSKTNFFLPLVRALLRILPYTLATPYTMEMATPSLIIGASLPSRVSGLYRWHSPAQEAQGSLRLSLLRVEAVLHQLIADVRATETGNRSLESPRQVSTKRSSLVLPHC